MVISVFLLDDHEVVRKGLRAVLDAEQDLHVTGEASTAAEALVSVPAVRPDVAILDVRLPDGEGVTVCRDLRTAVDPPPACLMLTSFSDDEALFGAVLAGAAGYLLKRVSAKDIVSAVRTAAAGGSLLDPHLTESMLARLRGAQEHGKRFETLSPQERRVLDLVAKGLTNRQIAEELVLAEKTVKNYVSSLLHKLGFTRRTEAAVFATRHGRPPRS